MYYFYLFRYFNLFFDADDSYSLSCESEYYRIKAHLISQSVFNSLTQVCLLSKAIVYFIEMAVNMVVNA